VIGIEIRGLAATAAVLRTYELGCRAAEATAVVVGTDLPYAYGQHEGRYRSGRLARRGGGTFYLTRAAVAATPRIARRVAAALPNGPAAVGAAMVAGGLDVVAAAVPLAPVKSGSLRRSIHVVAARAR
jgi:hypothetical protein